MGEQTVFSTEFNGLTSPQPTLPARWYFDPEHHARELREIWAKNWVYLCRAEAFDGPGAFRRFPIAGQDVIVLRDPDGELRGFHNTCRHRGSELCDAAEGRFERGRIVCPYHQWTFALDGKLLAAGRMRAVEGFEREKHGLYPVAVEEWRGFVFANLLGDDAPTLADSLAEETAPLANWPLETLRIGARYEKELACDWKLFWENFNECLHCPHIHPELSDLVPIYSRAIMVRKDDPEWRAHDGEPDPRWSGGLKSGAASWTMDGAAKGREFAGLTDVERAAGQTYVVSMPSTFIVGHVDYVRAVRIEPMGPARMRLSAEWLFPEETLADPAFDLESVTRFAALVMDQDGGACELNQRGLSSSAHAQGVLMQEEYEVFAFQEWVRRKLGEPTLSAPPPSRASRRKREG